MISLEIVEEQTLAAAESVPSKLRLPRELRAFWVASAIALLLTVIVCALKWRAGMMVYNWDPLSDGLFGDMMEYPGTYALLHTKAFFFNVEGRPWAYPMYSPVAYPPFAAAVMAPMYRSGQPELVFLSVTAVWLAVLIWCVRRWMLQAGIGAWTATLMPITLAAMSFPIARLVHQGNIELVVWIFTAVGVWAWVREKNDLAAVLWGLAAAMKLFPLVLLALLLPRRKWRAFAEGIGTFVMATVWALWWLGPTIAHAWHGTMRNVFGYQGVRVGEWSLRELIANHSTIELAKVVALAAGYPLAKLSLPYYALGALVFGTLFFGRIWRMPRANQLLAVSVFMAIFPAISYYHALVHVYAALIVLGWVAVQAARQGVTVRGLWATMILFVPLFVAFPLLTFPQVILFCGLVQACVLVAIFAFALAFPFELKEVSAVRHQAVF